MKRHILSLSLGTLAAAAWIAGCSTQYNGSLNFNRGSREVLETYRQSLRQRDLALQGQNGAGNAAAQGQPGAAMSMSGVAGADAGQNMNPSAQVMLANNLSATNSGAPDVYGRLPSTVPAAARPGSMRGDDVGNIQRVTFSSEGADFDPEIDPTGKWLIFASTRHRETSDLYFKRVDGSAVTQLTSDAGNDVMPSISPDGKQVAFASDRGGNWDIYLMDANGGQTMQMTSDSAHEIHPSFSPDGRWLVYCRYGDQSGEWELVVIELANPSTKRFIGYGLFPNWSPIDNRIVFQRARERGTRWFSIWTVELVDGQAMRPTEIAASSNAAVITPDFSPDGRYIVFCTVVDSGVPASAAGNNSADKPRQADIWMVDIEGRSRMNLTQSQFTNLQPVWAKDGTIYFTSNRSLAQGENVWSLKPDRALAVARGTMEPAATESAMAGTGTPPAAMPNAMAEVGSPPTP